MQTATLRGAQRVVSSCCRAGAMRPAISSSSSSRLLLAPAAALQLQQAPPAAACAAVASTSGRCSSYSTSSTTSRMLLPAGRSSSSRQLRLRPLASSAAAAPATATTATAARTATNTAGVGPAAPPKEQVIIPNDPNNNVTDYIYDKMGTNLHHQPDHPIGIIKQAIYDYFEGSAPGVYRTFDDLHPVVTTHANFDEILIPSDHISRSPNDTYYVSQDSVLRCHTSAHQAELLRTKTPAFLVTGDVYRRDSIDATHYPVFHQMEGVRVYSPQEWADAGFSDPTAFCERELKASLEGLAKKLFGDVECRWVDAYFPFTEPSFELEIFFNGKWLEVLGCGVMEQAILDKNYGEGHKAWAFGLGLERLAMVLFGIPDIRLFWSADERFLKQFTRGDLRARFKSYSKFPPCLKDMAFWLSESFTENNLCELVRGIGGDLVEEVQLIDSFTHPKTQRTSHCYRITYRSMERSLTDDEINGLQDAVRRGVSEQLGVELR